MPASSLAAKFRPDERVRRRQEFQLIYDQGAKIHSKFGTFFLLRNGRAFGRLGIAASRKFGRAVARNRAKRLIRDVFRRNKIAPGFDIVVIPKRALLEATLNTFEAEFRRILDRRPSR